MTIPTLVRVCGPLAALLLLAACSGSGTNSSGGGSAGGGASSGGASSGGASRSASPATTGASGGAAGAAPSAVSSPSTTSATGAATTVNMTDANQYQPTTITVARGATVTWMNTGQTPHTVTDDPTKAASPSDSTLPSGAQPWDSGLVNGGASFTHTFDTPGQYTYFCIPHESLGMIARITVTG